MVLKLLDTEIDTKKREWVIIKDALTGKIVGNKKHYSVGCFDQSYPFYKLFFDTNNLLVENAIRWNIELGKDYDKFFEQGFRISQKIEVAEGRIGYKVKDEFGDERIITIKEKWEEEFNKKRESLEEKLLRGIKNKKKEFKNNQYDSLYESIKDSLSQEDLEYMGNIISQLKDKDIMIKKAISSRKDLQEKLDVLNQAENKEIMEYFPKVPDNCKALFFHVLKYHELNEKKHDWFSYSVDELYKFMEEIGPENSKLCLKSLLLSLEKDENIYNTKNLIICGINQLSEDKWNLYFTTLYNFQEKGHSDENALNFADKIVTLDGEDRRKYLDSVEKLENAGIRDFTYMIMHDITSRTGDIDEELINHAISVYAQKKDERETWLSVNQIITKQLKQQNS